MNHFVFIYCIYLHFNFRQNCHQSELQMLKGLESYLQLTRQFKPCEKDLNQKGFNCKMLSGPISCVGYRSEVHQGNMG